MTLRTAICSCYGYVGSFPGSSTAPGFRNIYSASLCFLSNLPNELLTRMTTLAELPNTNASPCSSGKRMDLNSASFAAHFLSVSRTAPPEFSILTGTINNRSLRCPSGHGVIFSQIPKPFPSLSIRLHLTETSPSVDMSRGSRHTCTCIRWKTNGILRSHPAE